jgi:hypothetical protein
MPCRIVAGVSGSPGSVHALRRAAELARRPQVVVLAAGGGENPLLGSVGLAHGAA